ncbi:hypothetical protein CMV_022989, partial [Castanea mollissima]
MPMEVLGPMGQVGSCSREEEARLATARDEDPGTGKVGEASSGADKAITGAGEGLSGLSSPDTGSHHRLGLLELGNTGDLVVGSELVRNGPVSKGMTPTEDLGNMLEDQLREGETNVEVVDSVGDFQAESGLIFFLGSLVGGWSVVVAVERTIIACWTVNLCLFGFLSNSRPSVPAKSSRVWRPCQNPKTLNPAQSQSSIPEAHDLGFRFKMPMEVQGPLGHVGSCSREEEARLETARDEDPGIGKVGEASGGADKAITGAGEGQSGLSSPDSGSQLRRGLLEL